MILCQPDTPSQAAVWIDLNASLRKTSLLDSPVDAADRNAEYEVTFRDNAKAAIAQLGDDALFVVPLGVLGPFSQWLGWPDWLRDGTTIQGNGPLPQRLSFANDVMITANFLDRGHGRFLIRKALETSRLITGPTASIIIRNAPTLGEALIKLTALLDATNMNVAMRLARQKDRAEVAVLPNLPLVRMLDFVAAIRLILVLRTLERFLLRPLDSVAIELSMPIDGAIEADLRRLAETVEMGESTNKLSFPAAWLDMANPDFDTSLWRVAQQRLRAIESSTGGRDLVARLRRQVAFALASDGTVPRLKELAMQEGVTVRTLGRKLAATGVKFQDIVDRERRQRIETMLADPRLTLAEVAAQTGYSNLSSFSRAFRALYGVAPSEYRGVS